ncbi:unnamed protein product [Boreogadus saida]
MDGWIRDAGGEQIIQYLGTQMRRAENNYTKSQISIGGSVHSARSVTSCEKAHFMSSIVINNQHPLQRWSKALLRLHWPIMSPEGLHFLPLLVPLPHCSAPPRSSEVERECSVPTPHIWASSAIGSERLSLGAPHLARNTLPWSLWRALAKECPALGSCASPGEETVGRTAADVRGLTCGRARAGRLTLTPCL